MVSQKVVEQIGKIMVQTGVAILRVPDPLPVVDEVVGVVLVVGGAATVAYARYGMDDASVPLVAVTPEGLVTVPVKDITQSPGKTTASSLDIEYKYSGGTKQYYLDKSWRQYYASNR